MNTKVISESDIQCLDVKPDTVVLIESRDRLDEGRGVQVWALRALPPFVAAEAPAQATDVFTYVVVVDDPDNTETQDRVRKACEARLRAYRPFPR